MNDLSTTAMVLAAGLGTRMRPLTLEKPKPLQNVGGKTMLDHALDKLAEVGVSTVIVNTHYLPEQIEEHLDSRRNLEIIISREDELLDTGGGVAKALPYFSGKPFFVLNADLPWLDGDTPSLFRMSHMWDSKRMDCLLLTMRTEKAYGFGDKGDFALTPEGRLRRIGVLPPLPFVYIGAQIVKPELYRNPPCPAFSNNLVWNQAEQRNGLYGIEHEGSCYHVGTPEDLAHANALLETPQGWQR